MFTGSLKHLGMWGWGWGGGEEAEEAEEHQPGKADQTIDSSVLFPPEPHLVPKAPASAVGASRFSAV